MQKNTWFFFLCNLINHLRIWDAAGGPVKAGGAHGLFDRHQGQPFRVVLHRHVRVFVNQLSKGSLLRSGRSRKEEEDQATPRTYVSKQEVMKNVTHVNLSLIISSQMFRVSLVARFLFAIS